MIKLKLVLQMIQQLSFPITTRSLPINLEDLRQVIISGTFHYNYYDHNTKFHIICDVCNDTKLRSCLSKMLNGRNIDVCMQCVYKFCNNGLYLPSEPECNPFTYTKYNSPFSWLASSQSSLKIIGYRKPHDRNIVKNILC
jgi:hypothetical protein